MVSDDLNPTPPELAARLLRVEALLRESAWLDQHTCELCEGLQQQARDTSLRCPRWIQRRTRFEANRADVLGPQAPPAYEQKVFKAHPDCAAARCGAVECEGPRRGFPCYTDLDTFRRRAGIAP